jgi:glyoxylase-like metal-dependent hydrolase (beta-lactamase superfamily II)
VIITVVDTSSYVFSVEGATVRLIHIPGHTSDHLVLYLKEEKSLLKGLDHQMDLDINDMYG